MMFFEKKNNLNNIFNTYQLKNYYYMKNNEIYQEVVIPNNNFKELKKKCSLVLLSCLSGYSIMENRNGFEFEESQTMFNPTIENERVKKWLGGIPKENIIEVPDLEIASPIDIPLERKGFFREKLTSGAFGTFCENFNKSVDAIAKLMKDIKWIIQNPVQSVLIVDLFVFQFLAIFLIIFVIVAALVKMFSDKGLLKKPITILKDATLISFVLSIVLKCFVAAGCK